MTHADNKHVAVEMDLAVRRVVARYCQLIDDRDLDQVADLFAESARFSVPGADMHGRSEIRAWLDGVPKDMFHHVTNVVVSNGSNGTVHAVSDCTVGSRRDGGWSILMLGRYHDTLVGDARELRFSQRLFTAR